MESISVSQPWTILLVVAGLALGWILLRFVLRLTAKVFTCGCLALLILGSGAWLITSLFS
ncbi:MAG: hypothetical protein E4G99_04030 [Anaerolineales bacterium]|nr:MAG: hypothetical protein E4G99_04030 [Anaerolineales bacterium]